MRLLPLMTPKMRQSLGEILNSYVPDWSNLEIQARQATKYQKPLVKTPWEETDAYRSPTKGMDHDIWQIEGGICLQRHPTLIEKIIAMLLGLLNILFVPLRGLQKKIEDLIFALASRLGQIGGVLNIPFAILLMIIDFFRDYLVKVLKSITSPFSLVRTILSFPGWLVKTLLSRLIGALMAPLLAKILTQIQKTQQALVALLAKYGWLRGILLGMIRDGNRPDFPIVIPKKAVSEIVLKKKWSLFGSKTFLLVIEGDKLKPGFGEYISLKMKQIFFPYYWERTVHMMLMPKKEAEKVKSVIENALRHDGSADEVIETKEEIKPEAVAVVPDVLAPIATETASVVTTRTNYCPQCNSIYNLAKKFCGNCGVPLVAGTPAPITQDATPQAAPDVTQSEMPLTVPKTDKSRLLVGIVAAVLIAIGGYFGYDYIKNKMPGDKGADLSQNITQKETGAKPQASLPYASIGRGKILGDKGVDLYESITEKETTAGTTVFPAGSPSGKVISHLATGETVEILQLIPCDCEASITLKVKHQKGDVGYIPKVIELIETYGDKGAIASIYLSLPYEYEGDIETVNRDISKFKTFMAKYPNSPFVPDALGRIAGLQSYLLQCPMSAEDRQSRFKEMKSTYETLLGQYRNSKWARIANEIYDIIVKNETELCKSQVSPGTFETIIELQKQLSSLIPSLYVPLPSAKPQELAHVPVNKVNVDSGNNQKKLGSLEQYRNMYEPSEINYSLKYPMEFNMLYDLLKETLEKKELEDTVNRKASQLDEIYLSKIRFFAAPDSLKQQKQQHIDYVPILVNDTTLKEGLRFFEEYKDTIMKAYSKYNVKPEDIIAVINWESKFGKYKGEYSVYKVFVGNLFHISEMENQFYVEGGYEKKDILPRDKALGRIERLKQSAALNLAALLKLSIKKNFNPYEIKGSWAGAIGIPQFMPPSMIYAADGNGDAEIDLNNMHDAIFSVASFLYQHSYTTKGSKYSLTKYNPEEMYVRGVCLYSSRIMEKGLSY